MIKKQSPQVSVIIPIYHVEEKLLKRCLEKLVEQTEQNVEVLLIFDEEKSKYIDIIEKFSPKLLNIRTIEQRHQGVSAARNKGIQNAMGNWIAFVDADDWLEENALKVQMLAAEETGSDIVMGEHMMEYGGTTQRHKYLETGKIYTQQDKREFEKDILKPQTGAGFVWGKLFRREFLIEKNIFFNETLSAAEDAEFMFRAACEAQKISYIPEVCYHYWYNAGSAVRRYQKDYVQKYVRSMEALKQDIEEVKERQHCKEAYYSCVLYHLLLIAVNYSFHPGAGISNKEQVEEFKQLLKTPLFQEALEHVHYQDFSKTRKITLLCIKSRFYVAVWIIAKIRHWQFKKYSKR